MVLELQKVMFFLLTVGVLGLLLVGTAVLAAAVP
jgi:hypothetical protein